MFSKFSMWIVVLSLLALVAGLGILLCLLLLRTREKSVKNRKSDSKSPPSKTQTPKLKPAPEFIQQLKPSESVDPGDIAAVIRIWLALERLKKKLESN